jgi:GTP-binding protein
MADIPGIIEGASEGKGLGLRFLRHIERNALLLFMIPGDTDDIRHDYEVLLRELTTYNPELLNKQRVLAITKADLLDDELMQMLEADLPTDLPHLFISSVTGFHITQLKDLLWQQLDTSERQAAHAAAIVHRDKDITSLQHELEDEGEDLDIDIIDDNELEDIDDIDDFEIIDFSEQ